MRAKFVAAVRDPVLLPFALALGIVALGAGFARSETPATQPSPQNRAAVSVPAPQQQAAAPGFVCEAAPGSWCDLRDWLGFSQGFTPGAAKARSPN